MENKADFDELIEKLLKTDDKTLKSDIEVFCKTTYVPIYPSQDPALWEINSDMIEYFIRNPVVSNPKIINFDNTIRKCGEFNRKRKITTGIDVELKIELEKREFYWKSIIHRLIETIIFLSGRGLAFRGDNETLGSKNNGNYLSCLELIAKFDPLMFKHLDECDGTAVERFLCFIPSVGHKSKEIEVAMLTKLTELNININYCRGQSYDNARNKSGMYNGLQARIKEKSKNAIFSPCLAHTLNLIGCHAADVTKEDYNFFH
ncbi:uncharacterized protein LOC112594721 [Melanaphis sacchari]|uniref:uncharacterized protein LOC112594721 n=1 Tax=Melanaphis sacchari TaxID=742174 RepID=UPI000DC14BCD|nr:uncharacterized protein LOC112594721 [Melanaphis sacchari]